MERERLKGHINLERKPYPGKEAEIRYLLNKQIAIYIDGASVRYKEFFTVTREAVKS